MPADAIRLPSESCRRSLEDPDRQLASSGHGFDVLASELSSAQARRVERSHNFRLPLNVIGARAPRDTDAVADFLDAAVRLGNLDAEY